MYKLPSSRVKGRRRLARGTDKRMWRLTDWQVVYGTCEPHDTMSYENYVPADEADPSAWLEKEYGPFGTPEWPGRVVSQPR